MPIHCRRSAGTYWAVARTHPHKEGVALQALKAQEFGVVCPLTWKTVRRSRRLFNRKTPLFPGYIFIAFDDDARHWRPVSSTRGVQYLLTQKDGRPSRAPAGFVEELMAHTGEEGIFTYGPRLSPGQQVRVKTGAFADLVGRVEALDDNGRVRLMLELMAREVRVSLPGDCVQGIG